MGLAASQARLLLLTARKSDLEFRAQQITNTEMILAMQTETIAKEYSNKLSNKKMVFQSYVDLLDNEKSRTVDVTWELLSANGYVITDKNGKVIKPDEVWDAVNKEYVGEWGSLGNPSVLQNAIKKGIVRLYAPKDCENGVPKNGAQQVNTHGSTEFTDTYDTSDDAEATATFESKTAELQVKEKQLQIDLQQVEVQQKACETEIDSVKKILDKNIERTFKVFS